jgi:predicted transglutaminase-like cysteine proteinase
MAYSGFSADQDSAVSAARSVGSLTQRVASSGDINRLEQAYFNYFAIMLSQCAPSILKVLGGAMVAGLFMIGPATANRPSAETAFVQVAGITSPPIGWLEFCDNPDNTADCKVKPAQPAIANFNAASWKTLQSVNSRINERVRAATDQEQWGVADRWSYPTTGKGDSEDYALEKRRLLLLDNFPRQSLLITMVEDETKQSHVVLMVKTDRGDFILDNAEAKVLLWTDTRYRFLKRQSEQDPNSWMSLNGATSPKLLAASRRPTSEPKMASVEKSSAEKATAPKVSAATIDNRGKGKLTKEFVYAQTGAVSPPPIGWVEFCDNPAHKSDCDVSPMQPIVARLDEAHWRKLLQINANVNKKVKAVTDLDQWGVAERWSYPTTSKGDCEDYVLEKRRLLIESGFPRQSLLITVVRDKKNEGHAVLTVKTDRGDFILDNAEAKVLLWIDTGYRFVKRQSEQDPNTWLSLGNVHSRDVLASIRR